MLNCFTRKSEAEHGVRLAEKKVRTLPLTRRQSWIDRDDALPIVQQTRLVGIARSTVYATKSNSNDEELLLLRLIDEEYTRHPFYGNRRLMRKLGLVALVPAPNTSKKNPEHKIYPYLLRGVAIIRPNQVWSTDITYIRLAHGFAYLTAILDWYSRHVLSWRISNSLETLFCLECLDDALLKFGIPEMMNTDQGAQYTSHNWTNSLLDQGVKHAWMVAVGLWITFSLNVCGEPSNMKIFICVTTEKCHSCKLD